MSENKCGYLGGNPCQDVSERDMRIAKLEAELSAMKSASNMYVLRKGYEDTPEGCVLSMQHDIATLEAELAAAKYKLAAAAYCPACKQKNEETKRLHKLVGNLLAFFKEKPGITLPRSQAEINAMWQAAREMRAALKGFTDCPERS